MLYKNCQKEKKKLKNPREEAYDSLIRYLNSVESTYYISNADKTDMLYTTLKYYLIS